MRVSSRTTNKIAKILIWTSAVLVISVLLFIISYILVRGLPVLSFSFLTEPPSDMGREGGISSMIIGTLAITSLAVLIAVPFGIGTAIYLAEYTRDGVITRIIRFSAESLAGIPSIVYGLFGFIFFVIYLGLGWSIISGSLTLAFMVLPTIIRTSEEAIIATPSLYREASYSLGASKWQTIRKVVFPSAIRGVSNGVILSIGRCVAETAAVMLTAGSALRIASSIFSPTRTMAVHFYILAMEGISADAAFGTAAALIILILIINAAANSAVNRFIGKDGKR